MNDPLALSPSSLAPPAPIATENPAANFVASSKSRWPLWVLGGALALGVMGAGAGLGAYAQWRGGDGIAPGVWIAGVEVGGLSKSEARAQIARRFGDFSLQLQTGQSGFETTLADLGGAPSIEHSLAKAALIGRGEDGLANLARLYEVKTTGERLMLPIVWDKTALVSSLRALDAQYATKAVDARLEIDLTQAAIGDSNSGSNSSSTGNSSATATNAGGARVVSERLGRRLNIGATAEAIQKRYFVGTKSLKIYTREVLPRVSAAQLQGEDVLLASYPTRFNPGLLGRTRNIRVACERIDGRVLMPGEAFSFNGATGRRTWEKGYRMAHIFETKPGADKAEVVDGLAGGVCQVSSTLFNAVRRSNDKISDRGLESRIQIVERNSHSLPVTYVPSGLDATVAWPGKDFRFRNTLSHPIWLRTAIRRGKLTIGVWGRVPGGQTQLAASTLSTQETAN